MVNRDRRSIWRPKAFSALLIVAAGVAAYHNSLEGPFIFDDTAHVVNNPRLQRLWPFWESMTGSTRPLVMYSFALNYAWGGWEVKGYHLFNLVLHLASALVLWGVVGRTLALPALAERGERGEAVALGTAVVWVVHPLNTQGVTYVVQRAEGMMSFFCLLTLYALARGARAEAGRFWAWGAVVFCAMGMGCKPVMVAAPLLALGYDRVFLSGGWREVWRRRRWIHGGMIAAWGILGFLLSGPHESTGSAGLSYEGITAGGYARSQPEIVLHYLKLAAWPFPLCLDYGWPDVRGGEGGWPGLLLGVLLVGGVTYGAWWWPRGAFPLGAFLLLLAPSSSLVPVKDLAVEHRMYLPLAALVVCGVGGLFRLAGRHGWKIVVGMGIGVSALASGTVSRNGRYASEAEIWSDAVLHRPRNPRAHGNLGFSFARRGVTHQAIAALQRAVRLDADYPNAHNSLGAMLYVEGRLAESIVHLKKAVEGMPEAAEVRYNLANALLRQGLRQEAAGHYAEVLRLKPDFTEARLGLDQLRPTR
jgi:hypothetical protein